LKKIASRSHQDQPSRFGDIDHFGVAWISITVLCLKDVSKDKEKNKYFKVCLILTLSDVKFY